MRDLRVRFLGACETVTGSMHLISTEKLKVLVDAGMFQGPDELEELNWRRFPFRPSEIDYIVITHGHLDHVGLLPRLVKEGFSGTIIAHRATVDVAGVMLEDAVKVQEEELHTENRRRQRRGMNALSLLYDYPDVWRALRLFRRGIDYDQTLELGHGLSLTLRDAGHILGSAFAEFKYNGKTIIFSGDLGNKDKPIIRDPVYPSRADVVVCESTYGDRLHPPITESVERIKQIILKTLDRGGNVVIPSFALERSQDVLYYLREFHQQGLLQGVQVFLDSPLAINATKVFLAHPECYDQQARQLFYHDQDLFWFPGLKYTQHPEESKRINSISSRAIIIASSGMCTGGRIKHHLKHRLWNPKNSVIFVGYQARGTLGRQLVDGAKEVDIYWEKIAVRAEIHVIHGLSAHADAQELHTWIKAARPSKVFLVHGEPDAQRALAQRVGQDVDRVIIPKMEQEFDLFDL